MGQRHPKKKQAKCDNPTKAKLKTEQSQSTEEMEY